MVSLIELDQILADAARLTGARRSPARTQSLREALEAAVWMLGEEIEAEETEATRQARRQLRIETAALLSDLGRALRCPTEANQASVDQGLKAWNTLLQRLRQTLEPRPVTLCLRKVA